MYNGSNKVLDALVPKYSEMALTSSYINPELYTKYEVKRGLRDVSGKGVLAGLTDISEVRSYIIQDNDLIPCEGKLFYRGYDIEDLVAGFQAENRFGFEEITYLLLFGKLPNEEEYKEFFDGLSSARSLPNDFINSTIMNAASRDVMNSLAKSVLTLYSYDKDPDSTTVQNVLRQSIRLIAQFPLLAVYGYQGVSHYHNNNSLVIHTPDPNLSTSENILRLIRNDMQYTPLEAQILDLALVLHADHGGGNNSSFTTHVVTSSGTDTYSSVVASLGSLKGPRHGGANIKVVHMFENIKENIKDWSDDDEITAYMHKLLNKEAFDNTGLIYGIGHAVYSLSDPRAVIFKQYVERLAKEKGLEDEYNLYSKVERIAPEVISQVRRMYKGVSANVDFYSGFVYRMLGIPEELYTPLFAVARISGWSAHRVEEIVSAGKIIRPAYKSVAKHKGYVGMNSR